MEAELLDQKTIEEIVRRLVKTYNPRAIYLLEPERDNIDVNILVVVDGKDIEHYKRKKNEVPTEKEKQGVQELINKLEKELKYERAKVFFANPKYTRAYLAQRKNLQGGTDSTRIISEERDSQVT